MPDVLSRLNAALQGRYRVESKLGEGGMATVYLADDVKHGRKVVGVRVTRPQKQLELGGCSAAGS
jgi:serine/threonine-protein kinase